MISKSYLIHYEVNKSDLKKFNKGVCKIVAAFSDKKLASFSKNVSFKLHSVIRNIRIQPRGSITCVDVNLASYFLGNRSIKMYEFFCSPEGKITHKGKILKTKKEISNAVYKDFFINIKRLRDLYKSFIK